MWPQCYKFITASHVTMHNHNGTDLLQSCESHMTITWQQHRGMWQSGWVMWLTLLEISEDIFQCPRSSSELEQEMKHLYHWGGGREGGREGGRDREGGKEGGTGREGRRDRGKEDQGEVDILREGVGGRKKGWVSGRYFKQTYSRGRNSVLTMHGHNVQALLILIGHWAEVTGHFSPCNSFDIITIYAYFNSQFFSYLIKVYKWLH